MKNRNETTQAWTPEPWTKGDSEICYSHYINAEGSDPHADFAEVPIHDYHRAIECVNAAQGIPHLPAGIVAEMREAMKAFLDLHASSDMRPEDECHEVAYKCRAVLAKLEAAR